MGRVILFNGGVGGGLYMSGDAVSTIPAFPSSLLAHLRAVSDLLYASQQKTSDTKQTNELSILVSRVANLAVERVEAAVGPLDDTDSLVYLHDDGGFTCGSTGAPPRPVGWPPGPRTTLDELIHRDLIAADVIQFLERGKDRGLEVADMLNDPAASALSIGMKLSDRAVENLKPLAPSRLESVTDPVNRSVLAFYHKVIDDGRYVDTWMREPAAVAKSLGVELEIRAIDAILGSSAIIGRSGGDVANLSIEQGVVVVVVAIIVLRDKPELENVRDFSGIYKF
jgi:hypothetical protein